MRSNSSWCAASMAGTGAVCERRPDLTSWRQKRRTTRWGRHSIEWNAHSFVCMRGCTCVTWRPAWHVRRPAGLSGARLSECRACAGGAPGPLRGHASPCRSAFRPGEVPRASRASRVRAVGGRQQVRPGRPLQRLPARDPGAAPARGGGGGGGVIVGGVQSAGGQLCKSEHEAGSSQREVSAGTQAAGVASRLTIEAGCMPMPVDVGTEVKRNTCTSNRCCSMAGCCCGAGAAASEGPDAPPRPTRRCCCACCGCGGGGGALRCWALPNKWGRKVMAPSTTCCICALCCCCCGGGGCCGRSCAAPPAAAAAAAAERTG